MERKEQMDSTKKFALQDKAPPADRFLRDPCGGSNTPRASRSICGLGRLEQGGRGPANEDAEGQEKAWPPVTC